MFPISSVTPAQVKAGNKCGNLLNEIPQIIKFFVLSERNHQRSIQQDNVFNRGIIQNGITKENIKAHNPNWSKNS